MSQGEKNEDSPLPVDEQPLNQKYPEQVHVHDHQLLHKIDSICFYI